MNPSTILRQVSRFEQGALEHLIEATYEEAYLRVGGDIEKLVAVYQTMLDHLREVGPRLDFWDWFSCIAGRARPHPGLAPAGSDVKDALGQSLRLVRRTRVLDSWTEGAGRLVLNGWIPGLGVVFGAMVGVAARDGFTSSVEPTALAALLVLALVAASATALILGPWLGFWRSALAGRAFLPATLMASILNLVTFLFVAPAVFVLIDYHQGDDKARLPRLLATLDDWGKIWSPELLGGAILGGLLAGLLGRSLWVRSPWLSYRGDSWARRLLSLALCVPLAAILAVVAPLVRDGWTVNPEVQELGRVWLARTAASRRLQEKVSARYAKLEREGDAGTPRLEEDPRLRAWLAETRAKWTGRFWQEPEVVALGRAAIEQGLLEKDIGRPSGADRVEVVVRTLALCPDEVPATLLVSHLGRSGWDSQDRARLDAQDLARDIQAILARQDLDLAPVIDELSQGPEVAKALTEIAGLQAKGRWFRALGARARLNEQMRSNRESLRSKSVSKEWERRRALVLAAQILELHRRVASSGRNGAAQALQQGIEGLPPELRGLAEANSVIFQGSRIWCDQGCHHKVEFSVGGQRVELIFECGV